MIQVAGNKVQGIMGDEIAFFQAYMDNEVPEAPAASSEDAGRTQKRDDSLWLVIVLVLSGSTVLLFGHRIVQMRVKDSP